MTDVGALARQPPMTSPPFRRTSNFEPVGELEDGQAAVETSVEHARMLELAVTVPAALDRGRAPSLAACQQLVSPQQIGPHNEY